MHQTAGVADGSFLRYPERISFRLPNCDRHRSQRECIQCTYATLIHKDVNSLFSAHDHYWHAHPTSLSATVAGDKQVRVFDVGESVGRSPSGNEMSYSTRQSCIRILRCHSGSTKRIITEDSPDFFLTVAEVCIYVSRLHRHTKFVSTLGWASPST